jgi:hypothetical protein
VSIDQIEEVDDKLEPLNPPEKVSSFATVDFTVNNVANVLLLLGNSSGVYADCLNCSGELSGKVGAKTAISLAVCAIKTNGTLDMNGELTSVTAGQLKITFTMTSWGKWQNASNKLAVSINLKVPPKRQIHANSTEKKGRPNKFSLGAGAFMEFSRVVNEDDHWFSMPTGYPKYTSQGANNIFTLIFDHFNNSAIYDPNVEVGYEVAADDGASGDINAASTAVVGCLPLLAASLLQILARF